MSAPVVCVTDTSSLCEVRRQPNSDKPAIFARLTKRVESGRLVYPPQVVSEMRRAVDDKGESDKQYEWAKANEVLATPPATCTLQEVKQVLDVVPEVLDPLKDSGVEEADAYVLAAALKLRNSGIDARIVTQEKNDTPTKMSLSTAAGILGIPAMPLRGLLAMRDD
jgi:hypothetical protein